MKKMIQLSVFTVLATSSVLANAVVHLVPEVDGSVATLGLGLLAGFVALVAERRK